MSWKQPIPADLEKYTFGDKFAATLLSIFLRRARNEEGTVQLDDLTVFLKRGQCICGRYELAQSLGLKKKEASRVQRKLELMEKQYKLIDKQKNRNCSVITIHNYDELVSFEQTKELIVNSPKPNNGLTTITNKSDEIEKI